MLARLASIRTILRRGTSHIYLHSVLEFQLGQAFQLFYSVDPTIVYRIGGAEIHGTRGRGTIESANW
jgi:hypothetical protein